MFTDIVGDILNEAIGEVFGESLLERVNKRKLENNLVEAARRAHERFREEYSKIDPEAIDVLTNQTRFDDIESVQKAIVNILKQPFHDFSPEIAIIRTSFEQVFPPQFPPERIERALHSFLQHLGREVLYVPELQNLYLLLFAKANVESNQQIADNTTQMVNYLQQAVLTLPSNTLGQQSAPTLLPNSIQPVLSVTGARQKYTQHVIELIRQIDQCEKNIRQMKVFLSKLRRQPDLESEAELRRQLVKLDNLIAKLEETIDFPIELDILLLEFERIFQYQWNDEETIEFGNKLKVVAQQIVRLAYEQETIPLLRLTMTLGAIHKTLSEKDASSFFLIEKALPLLQTMERSKTINLLEATNYYFEIYDRICGIDTIYLSDLQSWAETHPLESERERHIATALTCSACRYLRRDQLDLAEYYIQYATESVKRYQQATSDIKRFKKRLTYLYLVQGVYLFKKGQAYFEIAEKRLLEFIAISKGTYGAGSYFFGYASYLLSKIYAERGNISQAIIHYQSAKDKLSRTIKRDFCMFDYKEVMNDLVR